jgi:hypothetical protein
MNNHLPETSHQESTEPEILSINNSSLNSDTRLPTTLVPLRCHNQIIKVPQRHTLTCPRIKMVASRHRPTHPMILPHGPILCKALRAIDRRRIHKLVCIDVVGTPVGINCPFESAARRRVVGSEGLHDVVLNQGVARPAVDREVAVTFRGEGAGVGDIAVVKSAK